MPTGQIGKQALFIENRVYPREETEADVLEEEKRLED